MEAELCGKERRETILKLLNTSRKPLSGSALGKSTGVSRQVVVQDIALLRTEGHEILATPKGYMMEKKARCVRLFKMCHTEEETEQELCAIVDLGGSVLDVIVNHRAYGKITAPISICSRRDVNTFIGEIKSGKSSLLMNVTSGDLFHHVGAASEEILDEIQEKLQDLGFLAEVLPYEEGNI